jgi:sRNA-binding protein
MRPLVAVQKGDSPIDIALREVLEGKLDLVVPEKASKDLLEAMAKVVEESREKVEEVKEEKEGEKEGKEEKEEKRETKKRVKKATT